MKDFFDDYFFLLPPFLLSFLFAALLTPYVKKAARAAGILDIPKDTRRMHKDAVPLAGGAAMVLAVVLSAILSGYGGEEAPILALISLCAFFGLIDDIFAVKPLMKIAFQGTMALLAALFIGGIEAFSVFGNVFYTGALALPLTVFFVMFMMNAVNLTDGMDGLAAGNSAIMAFSLSLILFLLYEDADASLALALSGACLGFLIYNSHKASVFMGETGSATLGFLLSVLSLKLFSGAIHAPLSVVVLLFLLPASETVSSFFRRILNGKSPFSADKSHIHHLLYARGFTVRRICLILYTFTALSCFSAIILPRHTVLSAMAFSLAVVFIRYKLRKKTRKGECRYERKT